MHLYIRETPVDNAALIDPESAVRACVSHLNELGHADQECFVIAALSASHRVLRYFMVSLGGVDTALVDLKIVFKRLLSVGAATWVAFHNHPGGSLEASDDDQSLTKRLVYAGKMLDLPLLDHVILSGDEMFSFRGHGLID